VSTEVAPVPELRAGEISAETRKWLASGHDDWQELITPAAILDGVATGALAFERIHRCVRKVRDRSPEAEAYAKKHNSIAVWACAEWQDLVLVESRFGPLGGDRPPAAAWNAWCVKYGMPERRVLSKAERDAAKAQNRPGLPAGPEKGTETAQLSNGISEPSKPRRAARARSAARA